MDLTPSEAVCGVPRGMGVHTTTCEHEALREAAIVRGEAFYRDNSGASWSVDCTCGGEIGQPCKVCNDGPIEAAYRAVREDAARAVLAMPDAELPRSRVDRVWVALVARGEDAARERADELNRLRLALADAENAQCGCLGGTLMEFADQGDQPRTVEEAVGDNPSEQP